MDDNISDDDDGVWMTGSFFMLFDNWRAIAMGIVSLAFWVFVVLSLSGAWMVPIKAVLVWGVEAVFVLTLISVLFEK